jgi:hypothetical protein
VKRRTAQALLWWLLPWIVARLLVPVGFMPVASSSELGWVLCSAAAQSGGAAGPTAPHGTDGNQHDAPCLFAVAGTCAAPPATVLAMAPGLATASLPIPADAFPALPAKRPRSHLARGPPQLS